MQRKPGKVVPIRAARSPAHYRTIAHQITHLLKAREADPTGAFWRER